MLQLLHFFYSWSKIIYVLINMCEYMCDEGLYMCVYCIYVCGLVYTCVQL